MRLAGWGNYPRIDCRLLRFRDTAELAGLVAANASMIARGNGRAYGDAALNPAATLSTLGFDRIRAFDPESGRITCEAGVLLADLLDLFVPRGLFPPVTPGTRFVTVGGMVAADVHGKNHHVAGSFGRHVERLEVMVADGRVVACSAEESPDLFRATIGGMGLTGVILTATFRLAPIGTAWMRQETLVAADLDAAMALFEESADWTYSVAWIDCLARGARRGRSVVTRGEHARLDELPSERRQRPLERPRRPVRRVPIDLPGAALNRWTVRAFNEAYFRRARPGTAIVDYETFFYPLDALLEWNRIYGASGFTQYQCVLPKAASREGLARLLDAIARAGQGSFLAVLKLFGPSGGGAADGLLSFPMEGYTLALDFPARAAGFALMTELDAIVADLGGRLYLAKDARMGAGMLARGYPALDRFRAVRDDWDAGTRFSSLLAERVGL